MTDRKRIHVSSDPKRLEPPLLPGAPEVPEREPEIAPGPPRVSPAPPAPEPTAGPSEPSVTVRPRRRVRRAKRSQPAWLMPAALVAVVGALVAVVALRGAEGGTPEAVPGAETTGTAPARDGADRVAYTVEPLAYPTPVFAMYRSMRINLPLPPEALTVVAFHQASNTKAMPMRSLLTDADMSAVSKKGTDATYTYTVDGDDASLPDAQTPGILEGPALRMWRSNRTGATDRCADVGAVPGTAVYAPVTGRVLLVRAYELYDKYPDYEIHIQPEGWPEVDCVLIHVDEVAVCPGDEVVGGITPIAKVRLLSDRFPHQVARYVAGEGDHVHLQLNQLSVPGRIEIDGREVDITFPDAASSTAGTGTDR